ncbi:MAG: diaminopimelate epimerase [Candidatus Aminicenantes bacterium]|nr:MAG: diaminopimelate epimerase [Candidatus Aminicenantes bacterium]
MIFYKTVTAGNDFIHIDMEEYESPGTTGVTKGHLAQRLCSRHTGAGADGVVYYKISRTTKSVDFEIFNRDGEEAELSGNGMAGCSALLFYLKKAFDRDHVILNTKIGPKKNTCLLHEKNKFRLKVEIGTADFQNRDFFPFLEEKKWDYKYNNITFYPVSVGNPHVVVPIKEDIPGERLEQMGKMLESAAIFPYKTNVEFILPTGENFRVFYYERGVGRTLSSSTGSAAVFAVLKKLNLVKDTLTIPFPGENIKISGKNKIYIENSTEIVYKGVYLYT